MKRKKRSPECYVGGVSERDMWEGYFKIYRSWRGTRRAFVRGVDDVGSCRNPFGMLNPIKRKAYDLGATFYNMFFRQAIRGDVRDWPSFRDDHIKALKVG